jgi:hypothetical protein
MAVTSFSLARQYTHIQSTPNVLWDITYNMDMVPIVEVLVMVGGQLEKILPQSIERVTNSRVKVHFSVPYAGEAHIVG